MRPGALAYARARAQLGLLLALAGVVLAASFALIGLDALHRTSARDAVDQALRTGPATDAALNLEISADRATDLEAHLRTARFAIAHNVHTDGFTAVHNGTQRRLVARADAGLPARSVLVDGRWPEAGSDGLVHAALQARAAKALHLGVGDRLRAGSGADAVEIVIDGTWRPDDASATAWFGDPASASGANTDGAGPLVVTATDVARLPATATASYVLTPRPAAAPAQARRDLRRLTAAIDDPDLPVTVTGGLPQRLSDLEATRAAGDGLLAVAYTLLALTALVTCRQVIALLTAARHGETALRRSRGATLVAMTASAALETVLVAAIGAGAGTVAAIGAFTAFDHAPDTGLAVLVAALCVLMAVVLAGSAAWASARRVGLRRDMPRDAGGTRVALLVLALAAAGLTLGQFIAYDGPLTVDSSGATKVDPITSLAPATTLAALTLLGASLAVPFLRLRERRTRRGTGLTPSLPASQLARRLPMFGVAIVLVSFAVGFAILVATIQGTQSGIDETAARVRTGADARLDLTVGATADVGVEATTARLMGLGEHSATVTVVPGRVDQEEVSFLAAPPTLPSVVDGPGVGADTARITAMLRQRMPGVPIDAGPVDVRIDLKGAAISGDVRSAIWLADRAGRLAVRPMPAISPQQAAAGPVTRTVTVPANPSGWRLLAVAADASGVGSGATISYRGLPGADRYDAVLANGRSSAHAVAGAEPDRLPVVITPAVAALVHAGVGDTFDLLLPDSGFKGTVTVAGIHSIPGLTADRGIAADLPTLVSYALAHDAAVPAPNSVWVASRDADAVGRHAIAASAVRVSPTTAATPPGSRIVAAAVDSWWWAAGSVIVFAALAAAAMTASLSRTRRDELQVLRALGLTPSRQSRIRLSELGGAILIGAVIGVLAGAVTVLLTVEVLSRSATPGRPASVDPHLSFVVPGFLALAAVLAVGGAAVAVTYARRVRREARQAGWRGDAA